MEELGNQLNVLDKKNKCSYRETICKYHGVASLSRTSMFEFIPKTVRFHHWLLHLKSQEESVQ